MGLDDEGFVHSLAHAGLAPDEGLLERTRDALAMLKGFTTIIRAASPGESAPSFTFDPRWD